MENASKALIIAGAILVSILLIGIGVALINALNSPMGQAEETMGGQAMQIFNAKFEKYAGQKQSGANVKSLLSEIITNNVTTQNDKAVTVYNSNTIVGSTSYDISIFRNNIVSSATYKVDLTYDDKGYINKVTITKVT